MKYQTNPDFLLKEIAGEYVLIARGAQAIDFGAVIVFNDTGILLWKTLENGATAEQLTTALVDKYGISAEQAASDVDAFLKKSLDEGIVQTVE